MKAVRCVVSLVLSSLIVLAGLLAAPAGAGAPTHYRATLFTFRSAAGDWIGQGASGKLRAVDATFTMSGNASGVTVDLRNDDTRWRITLAAPSGETLRPGRYTGAERAAFRTGRSPGLDVSSDGRGCNEVHGRFAIDQIKANAEGKVTQLDATFRQFCESPDEPPLKGHIVVNAAPMRYAFASDPGDWVGQGDAKTYTGSTSLFELEGSRTGIDYEVSGLRDDWRVSLAPVAGEELAVGVYADAQRTPFRDPGHPGLSVSGNGRGCNELSGSFEIRRLLTNAAGEVTALHATFEQFCDGDSAAYRGTIRFRA